MDGKLRHLRPRSHVKASTTWIRPLLWALVLGLSQSHNYTLCGDSPWGVKPAHPVCKEDVLSRWPAPPPEGCLLVLWCGAELLSLEAEENAVGSISPFILKFDFLYTCIPLQADQVIIRWGCHAKALFLLSFETGPQRKSLIQFSEWSNTFVPLSIKWPVAKQLS